MARLTLPRRITATLSLFSAIQVTSNTVTAASPVSMAYGRTLHLHVLTPTNVSVGRTVVQKIRVVSTPKEGSTVSAMRAMICTAIKRRARSAVLSAVFTERVFVYLMPVAHACHNMNVIASQCGVAWRVISQSAIHAQA